MYDRTEIWQAHRQPVNFQSDVLSLFKQPISRLRDFTRSNDKTSYRILKRGHACIILVMHCNHYNDVIMDAIASQITSLTIVYSTVYSDADPRKHQNSASLAFVRGFHRGPVNSPHKWPVTLKMFSFDDVIMTKTIIERDKTVAALLSLLRTDDRRILLKKVGGAEL